MAQHSREPQSTSRAALSVFPVQSIDKTRSATPLLAKSQAAHIGDVLECRRDDAHRVGCGHVNAQTMSLAICYLGCLWLREPLVAGDFVQWAGDGELPYLVFDGLYVIPLSVLMRVPCYVFEKVHIILMVLFRQRVQSDTRTLQHKND